MNLQVFKSWDEISIGDEIIYGDGRHHRLTVTQVPGKGGMSLQGFHHARKYGNNPGWSTIIAKTLDSPAGWKKVITELQYDPNQQGDKDEDI